MFYQLPPAGNPIHLSAAEQPELYLQSFFSPYRPRYFASGTAALAAAITAAVRLKNVEEPEVVLPAYGCPDLVSAAVFAGAKPVLVDLEPDRPWIDLEQLPGKICEHTVAIVATNLFGISERIEELRRIAKQAGVMLIEDSAQAFPSGKESDIWGGDCVVLSFGRGKPVSLLGGGVVLFHEAGIGELLPAGAMQAGHGTGKQVFFRLKVKLYNHLLSPRLYWLPGSLPFLHLGETRYHPLTDIGNLDQVRMERLPANITAYRNNALEIQEQLAQMIEELDSSAAGIIDLPKTCQVPRKRWLLRYPLLIDVSLRDRLYQQLQRSGVGPSIMYPAALPGIPGLQTLLPDQGPFHAAEDFAARILTLPTHQQVRLEDIAKIRRILCSG